MADPIITHDVDDAGKPVIVADFADGESFQWPATAVEGPIPPTPTKPVPVVGFHAMPSNDATKGTLVTLMWSKYTDPIKSLVLYRDGAIIQADYNKDSTSYEDFGSLKPSTAYKYEIKAKATDGTLSDTAIANTTTLAPDVPIPPTPHAHAPAPTNLSVRGMGSKVDQLAWDGVPNATKYNIYSDDRLLGSATAAAFTVTSAMFIGGRFYTVTAVDANGMESMACPPCLAQGGTGSGGAAPEGAPSGKARGEWNNGVGRIVFEWNWVGGKASYWGNQFRVWRDGQVIADFLSTFYFIDNNPGTAQHTYEVAVLGNGQTGPRSVAATATAPGHGPATGGKLLIVDTIPNDSSVKVILATYPGALDYRAYEMGHPERCKYAGKGSLTIEVNNINPSAIPQLIVEALDKLGPFMTMDGTSNASDPFVSKATRPMGAGMAVHANGQGDPSNVPNVIATSSPTTITLKPKSMPGKQVFLDNFRTFAPLVQSATVDPNILKFDPYVMGSKPNNAKNPYIKEYKNDKWRMMMFICNAQDTKLFGMSRHFMDTVFDGGVPGGGPEGDSTPPHNNNSTTTFEPLVNGKLITFDFSGGKVLHVTMEVDPHFTPRRWCDMGLYPAGDSLTDPALQKLDLTKFEAATMSGNILCWEIMTDLINLRQFIGDGSNTAKVKSSGGYKNAIDTNYPGDHGGTAERGPNGKYKLNGTQGDLDIRHTFDLYTDGKRVVAVEEHKVLKDTAVPVPLTYNQAHVFFSHHVYHIVNELSEAARRGNEPYYTNYRQMSDERHWNNMGAEVLDVWPTSW